MLWGGVSNTVCQLLSLFFGIYLARLLGPDDYGPSVSGFLKKRGYFCPVLTGIRDKRKPD